MKSTASITYLILAYRDPQLLGQLTRWLASDSAAIFVHVDAGVDKNPFVAYAHRSAKFIEKRFRCPWGSWGRVGATLEMLSFAVGTGSSHVALLSEDSFPLRSPSEIPSVLGKNPSHIWIEAEPMGGPSKPLSRLSKRSYFRSDPRYQSPAVRFARRLPFTYERIDWKKRLKGLAPWAGDSWWIVPRYVAVKVLEYVRSNPETVRFFSGTWIPDEHFFQTVVLNYYPEAVLRGSPMFADWTSGRSPHPPFLLEVSSERQLRLAREDYFFARKLEKVDSGMSMMIEQLWKADGPRANAGASLEQ